MYRDTKYYSGFFGYGGAERMNGRNILTFAVLLFLLALCILEWVYIPLFGVKPGHEAIPFWQHPPQAILFHALYLISPELMKLADFLFCWCVGFGFWFGFRQITANNVLLHPERERIFTFIRDHPGMHFRELERETGINRGTLAYHLGILEQANKLLAFREVGYTRYFENRGRYSAFEQKILSSLMNDRKRTILLQLSHAPASPAELRENLGITGASVSWHMQWLCNDHLVTSEKTGKNVRYILNRDVKAFLLNDIG